MKLLIIVFLALLGCKHSDKTNSGVSDSSEEGAADGKPKSQQDIDLKMAEMTAKMQEMELQLEEQKQKTKVLEKGMLTGLVPEEFVEKKKDAAEGNGQANEVDAGSKDAGIDYKAAIAKAEAHYKAKNCNASLAVLRDLEKASLGDQEKNVVSYWQGLCLYQNKNYMESRVKLSAFIEAAGNHEFTPNASLHIAKIDKDMGLIEKSLEQFRAIIEKYPNTEVSKIAKWEISDIEDSI
ncbi:MAG: tol-pal system YbgF family protein [Oligoflexales bacterium]